MRGDHRPRRRPGRGGGKEARGGRAEAHLLALHVRRARLDARVAVKLEVHREAGRRDPQHEHRREQCVPLPPIPDQPAERERERERNHQKRPVFDEVRERGRVLERMGRVRVRDPAAVRAQLLDRLLTRDRRPIDRLRRPLNGLRVGRTAQALHHALTRQQQRDRGRERQKNAGRDPREVDPEVADRRRPSPDQPTHQRNRDRYPDRGRNEVLHSQPHHLREMAHRRLARVVLPVRVRHKARRRVERQRRGHAGDVRRIQRQHTLHSLEQVQADNRHSAEREHRQRVHIPWLLPARIDARRAIQHPLDREKEAITRCGTAAEHARQVHTEQRRAHE